MSDITTGSDWLRASLGVWARRGNLGMLARECSSSVQTLDDFIHRGVNPATAVLKSLGVILSQGTGTYDETRNVMIKTGTPPPQPMVKPPTWHELVASGTI